MLMLDILAKGEVDRFKRWMDMCKENYIRVEGRSKEGIAKEIEGKVELNEVKKIKDRILHELENSCASEWRLENPEEVFKTLRRLFKRYESAETQSQRAEIEAEIFARKEEWKKKLLAKLPKRYVITDAEMMKIADEATSFPRAMQIAQELQRKIGHNECLSQVRQIIEEA